MKLVVNLKLSRNENDLLDIYCISGNWENKK